MKKSNDKDNTISCVICIIIISLFFTNLLSGLNMLPQTLGDNISNIFKGIIFLCLIYCIPMLFQSINKKMILYILGIILFFLLQCLFFYDNKYFFENFLVHVTTIFPIVICFLAINNYKLLLDKLIKISFGISVITLVLFLIFKNNMFSNGYSMGFANIMIFPSNILIYYLFNNKLKKMHKLCAIILFIANFFIILAVGSRGALINIMFFLLYMIFFEQKNKVRKYIFCLSTIIVFLIIMAYSKEITVALSQISSKIGLNSRTLNLLLSNNINHDSGRRELWAIVLSEICVSPFSIRGINADYLLIGIYSHNFIIELLYEFGILLGVPFIIYIIYAIFKTVISKNNYYTNLLKILLFNFFPLILWSATIWTSMFFWIWLLLFDYSKIKCNAEYGENLEEDGNDKK